MAVLGLVYGGGTWRVKARQTGDLVIFENRLIGDFQNQIWLQARFGKKWARPDSLGPRDPDWGLVCLLRHGVRPLAWAAAEKRWSWSAKGLDRDLHGHDLKRLILG